MEKCFNIFFSILSLTLLLNACWLSAINLLSKLYLVCILLREHTHMYERERETYLGTITAVWVGTINSLWKHLMSTLFVLNTELCQH